MGREVRKVPADWQHPKNAEGYFIPLLEGSYETAADEWDEGHRKWAEGLCENWGAGPDWRPVSDEYRDMTFTEYHGRRPSPDDYMPDWPDDQRTHFMMYEDTSEGTPISPAFGTPEELARWLADTGASAFAGEPASYEAWLRVANGGFACNAVITNGVMQSGVEALTND